MLKPRPRSPLIRMTSLTRADHIAGKEEEEMERSFLLPMDQYNYYLRTTSVPSILVVGRVPAISATERERERES